MVLIISTQGDITISAKSKDRLNLKEKSNIFIYPKTLEGGICRWPLYGGPQANWEIEFRTVFVINETILEKYRET